MPNQIYIALLRGINVGGNNKIDMKQLKTAFESEGFENVKTYINTGNIIFTDDTRSQSDIITTLEEAIETHFNLQIKVLLRTLKDFETLMQHLPETWTNDENQKSDVLFLWEAVDRPQVIEELTIKPKIDTVHYVPGAILWNINRANVTRSGLQELPKSKLYKQVTIRNVNTTRKIYELMQQAK